jgi:hypothetical protein
MPMAKKKGLLVVLLLLCILILAAASLLFFGRTMGWIDAMTSGGGGGSNNADDVAQDISAQSIFTTFKDSIIGVDSMYLIGLGVMAGLIIIIIIARLSWKEPASKDISQQPTNIEAMNDNTNVSGGESEDLAGKSRKEKAINLQNAITSWVKQGYSVEEIRENFEGQGHKKSDIDRAILNAIDDLNKGLKSGR